MDFKFSPEEEVFRGEVRDFFNQELPADYVPGSFGDEGDDESWNAAIAFQKKLGKRGWIAPAWPKEYGGAGMSIMQQLIYNEEVAYKGAPIYSGPGVGMIGPTLIVHGTEEQKKRHLPGITAADVVWCQGYSEPGAGSDLASLQTRAVRDGDDFVINGQKIWTSYGGRAQWMAMLARTDPEAPKHRGITFFLLDMKSPGVSVLPLTNLMGQSGFINQVFFDNVRVPKENMVGEENRGWYVGVTLHFERSNISGAAMAKRDLDEFVKFCKETKDNEGRRLIDFPQIRYKLTNHAIEIEAGRYICYRVASIQARGQVPNTEASASKLFISEIGQRFTNTKVNIMGLYGQLRFGSSGWERLGGHVPMGYMGSIPGTIAGGSSEVQRNIIATRGLGLPRG